MSRHAWLSLGIFIVFILSILIVFPINRGTLFHKQILLGLDLQGGTRITYSANLTDVPQSQRASAVTDAMAILQNRLNPLGVSEASVRALGANEIVVEIPGQTLSTQQKDSLGRTALLEFGVLASDNASYKWVDPDGSKWTPAMGVADNKTLELTSAYFQNNTYVTTDQTTGQPILIFNWDATGSQLSQQITTELYNNNHARLGIFEGNQPLLGQDGQPIAPAVQGIITSNGQITGLNIKDASLLSKQLNAGRLPIPLNRTGDELTIQPSLGSQFASTSVRAAIIALIAVMIFMTAYYRVSGLIASAALIYYGVLLLAIFKLFNVTMTLSAIGGFVLSLGMAVDANVLIFERTKEELWGGRTLSAAIEAGFSRAWPAIWDSNITTILAGFILLWLGSSNIASSAPVKGFAVTLIIGVASSMFTAVTVTRTLLRPFASSTMGANVSLFTPFQRKKND